ncbi:MAG: HdeD family acid-resistance protein [Alphaproteobacteria bacterium]|nr:HdeD family acid-resistance protein [Alphaproteobacteria bacterium]
MSEADGENGAMRSALHEHWKLFLGEGVVLLILGFAAIIVPAAASLAMAIVLGWIFLAGGVVGLLTTLVGHKAPGFWWSLLSALVAIAAGAALVGWPVGGVISLTFVLTAFLIADGILTMLFAAEHRRRLSQRWGFLFLNGVLDLVLAGLIIWALPGSAIWALGLIVGIDLIFGGWSLVAMAVAARKPA